MPGITMPPDASISRRAVGHVEAGADRRDPVADDQHVAGRVDRVAVVHGQHGAAAQDDRRSAIASLLSRTLSV